jgi:Protein of unknown function (DUF4087)
MAQLRMLAPGSRHLFAHVERQVHAKFRPMTRVGLAAGQIYLFDVRFFSAPPLRHARTHWREECGKPAMSRPVSKSFVRQAQEGRSECLMVLAWIARGCGASVESAALLAAVVRCGWFDNPSPSNAWLHDRDGAWSIGIQGSHQAKGRVRIGLGEARGTVLP